MVYKYKNLLKLMVLTTLFWEAAYGLSSKEQPQIDCDRWLEADLYLFHKNTLDQDVDLFLGRIAPLLENVNGWRGIILNVGWLTDFVFEWTGDIKQPLPIPQNLSRQYYAFTNCDMLTGNTEERVKKASERKERFTRTRVYYDDWTYADFQKLVETLRLTAKNRYALDNLKIGVLFVAWDRIYTSTLSTFAQRHPEAYKMGIFSDWGTLNLECKLNAETRGYAAFPAGIVQDTPIYEFFGKQWGSVSKAVGLDAILLRDAFLGSGVYRRTGPYGLTAPSDPGQLKSWSKATANFVKATKLGNPNAIVMGYSNAASAIADWRINCMDLEAIAKEGFLDVWIDQTWAGEESEFGIRGFWASPFKGWTYHLAYVLLHAAILAETNVRHYVLTEGVDAWEVGDVIHPAPERLKWGIWAFHHAAVKTPNGLKMPRGSYIAFVYRGNGFFTKDEIGLIANSLNSAISDARSTSKIFGPTMVYCRDAMAWQNDNAPDKFINEWIDEQMAAVIKWAVPCLSVTRSDWLNKIETDLPVIQTPVHLSDKQIDYIASLIQSGKAVAIFASAAGGIDPKLAELVGIKADYEQFAEPIKLHTAVLNDPYSPYIDEIPYRFSFLWQLNNIKPFGDAKGIYLIDKSTPLVVQKSESRKTLFWDPAILEVVPEPKWDDKPIIEWIKSSYPYVLVARVMHDYLKDSDSPWVDNIREDSAVTIHAWELKDGSYRVLAGNTEEGLQVPHDRDYSEHIVVQIPKAWINDSSDLKMTDTWKNKAMGKVRDNFRVDLEQAECTVYSFEKE